MAITIAQPLQLSVCRSCSARNACKLCPHGIYDPRLGQGQPENARLQCPVCFEWFVLNQETADFLFNMGVKPHCGDCSREDPVD